MTPEVFVERARTEAPPAELSPALRGLWLIAQGDWDGAHAVVQDDASDEAAWVHAYLHRQEGDLGNARYWYAQAGREPASGDLESEWRGIVTALLATNAD